MKKNILMNGVMGLILGAASFMTNAASIEGFWKSIDDQTGGPLSIIEIRKVADGTYAGTILYRYPNGLGAVQKECNKCPPPYKGKPLIGLQILSELKQDPQKPGHYTDGKVLEAATGKIYKGKVDLNPNGNRLLLRGYVGVSLLGKTQVWLRTSSAEP